MTVPTAKVPARALEAPMCDAPAPTMTPKTSPAITEGNDINSPIRASITPLILSMSTLRWSG